MHTIAQRELRNRSSEILRAAEAGETFVITVNGRPVATLGPYRRQRWVPADRVRDLLATPTDESVLADLAAFGDVDLHDPWAQP